MLSVLNLFIFWCWTIFLFGKRMCVLEESLLFEAVVAQLPLLSVPCIEFGSTMRSFRKTKGEACLNCRSNGNSWFGSSLLPIHPLFTCVVLTTQVLVMKKIRTSAFRCSRVPECMVLLCDGILQVASCSNE